MDVLRLPPAPSEMYGNDAAPRVFDIYLNVMSKTSSRPAKLLKNMEIDFQLPIASCLFQGISTEN